MPRNGVTFEEVVLAANQILAEGQNPTIEKVRQHVGSGSHSTISKFLQAWRQQNDVIRDPLKITPPDIVKFAAEQAWLEISKQADAQINLIKNETAAAIAQAEQRAQLAMERETTLKQELESIQEQYNAILAAKELLSLDLKKQQHDYALLLDRHQNLEAHHTEIQVLHTHHLADLSSAQQKQTHHFEEKLRQQETHHQQLIDEIKSQNEKDRHRAMLHYDVLREENKKLLKSVNLLKEESQQKDLHITQIETTLKAQLKEREESLTLMAEQIKQWNSLQNKSLIADDILMQISNWPKVETVFTQLQKQFHNSVNSIAHTFNQGFSTVLEEVKCIKATVSEINLITDAQHVRE